MASGLFSSIQSLSTKLLQVIRGSPSAVHQLQQHDPLSPVTDQHKSVRADLEKLSRMLRRIQAVQQDAEEREIHDRSIRLWLAELKGVGYQAEDVLDEFYYEVLRSIVESGDAAIEAYHRDGGAKRKFGEMYTSSSLTSKVSIPNGMAEKIKSITERFEEISNARRDFHLREEDGTRLVIGPQIRPPTSSHLDERATFGREEEKEEIISILDHSDGPDFMVLPIVGMGGFGKTTLAQLVFNDSRIHGLFNKRCWVSVSEDFDPVRLTKAIVESVSDNPCEFSELNKLQDVLKEKISGHGLFLVLDDVWNEQRNLWERFRVGFLGAKFVRILTTTRNTSVAEIMQTTSPFQLSSLPEENCWSLFKHFSFGNRETSENANLHEIGRGIVKKCKGSPLAIKALGGILRYYEMDEEKWREILESDISEIDEKGEVMPALRLSYQKLPQHLKPCFLYLSMFPKDYRFEKGMVIRLWMAQGYINGNTRNLKTLEEIGSEYFDELQGRSLVNYQYSSYYILHDLIHDLARSVSQEAYWLVLENDQEYNGPCKVCHLYISGQDELLGLVPSNYRSIRTFVKGFWSEEEFDFPNTLEIAWARALHLRYCSSLPNTFGTLKHLRYLSVNMEMEVLPETLCLLYNLQTLVLNCPLLELPENMKNLSNLRYFELNSSKIQHLPESIFPLPNLHTLLLGWCDKIKELPKGIEQSTRLRILDLPRSHVNMPSGGLRVLKNMNKLRGSLCISGLRNIVNVELCRTANLASKPNLHQLVLNFEEHCGMHHSREELHLHLTDHSSNNAKSENDEKIHNVVLQSLQPHGNLTDLTILNYGGRNLPPFGQLPYLRFLEISGWAGVKNAGDELNTYSLLAENGCSKQPEEPSYPSLEVLTLRNVLNLVEWHAHNGDFPHLKTLIIEDCPKLWKITTIPQEVREVTIKYCPKLELLTCPSGIKELDIHECGFREILFGSIFDNLTISNCVELTSICWREGGLYTLREVRFECCPKLTLIAIPVGTLKLKIHECGFREIMFRSVSDNLTISNCIELISINWRDGGLNSVREVTFEYCPKLQLITIPVATLKLNMHECGFHEIIFQSVFENLTISNCLELISINWRDLGSKYVREVSFDYCPKLEFIIIPVQIFKLRIHECGSREIIFRSISENLTISNCVELISVKWKNIVFNSVREVSFEYCPKLEVIFIPVRMLKLRIYECGFREIIFWSVSENLTISNCVELISINWRDRGLITLGEVTFEYCPKLELVTIPVGTFNLKIHECGFREIMFQSVSVNLTISNCVELISTNWSGRGLISVRNVSFQYCPKLKLPTIPTGIEKLKIGYCGIQEIIFPLQSSIQMVDVFNCPVLASIHWVTRATLFHTNLQFKDFPELQKGLKYLRISHCPILHFAVTDVLRSKIQMAEIYDCPIMDLDKRYVYQRDTVTRELNLYGNKEIHLPSINSQIPLLENHFTLFLTKEDFREVESLTCAPSVGLSCQCIMLNLASLVILEIYRCRKVISVRGLDNLSNLKCVSISYCPELCNWNDKILPPSLKFLELDSCHKLTSLPLLSIENHSSTLKVLVIMKCPRLAVLEGFHGLMKLKNVELLHCRNISISPATESLQFRPLITIGGCPLMRDWCQRNIITYNELIDNPQDDREAKLESAQQESDERESGEQGRARST